MKKIMLTAVVALAVFAVSCFAGCSNNADASYSRSKMASPSYLPSASVSHSFPFFSSNSEISSYSGVRPASRISSSQSETSPLSLLASNAEGVSTLIDFLGDVTISNYQDKEQKIIYAENKYEALSQEEKIKVANYDKLQTARQRFNQFKISESNSAVSFINNAVETLATFEFSENYKNSVLIALSAFDELNEETALSLETEKATLNGYLQKYFNTETVNKVMNVYNALPDSITDASIGNFRLFLREFSKLTTAQLSLVSDSVKADSEYLTNYVKTNYSFAYEFNCVSQNSNSIFKLSGTGEQTRLTQQNAINYNSTFILDAITFDGNSVLSITTPYGGYLKIYASSTNSAEFSIKKGSTKLDELGTMQNGYAEILLPSAGCYSICISSGENSANIGMLTFN